MVAKVPPPPQLPLQFQQLNRWLIELQNILNAGGFIEPDQVDGLAEFIASTNLSLAALQNQLTNLANRTTLLETAVTQNSADIANLQVIIAALQIQVNALTARSSTLNGVGAPSGALGSNGDLYVDSALPGAGANLYVKFSGTWFVIA